MRQLSFPMPRFEGIRLLSDLFFRLSPQLAHSLKWNRWANDRGFPDTNKPLDLKIEQVNKITKGVWRRLGPNLKQSTVASHCKAAPVLHEIRVNFRKTLKISKLTSKIPKELERKEDVKKVIEVLTKIDAFTQTPKRKLAGFRTIPKLSLSQVDRKTLKERIALNKAMVDRVRVFVKKPGDDEDDHEEQAGSEGEEEDDTDDDENNDEDEEEDEEEEDEEEDDDDDDED